MAIIAPQTAPNFAHGEYHRITRAEIACSPGDPNPCVHIWISFYASAHARNEAPQTPMWTHHVVKSIGKMVEDGQGDLRELLYAVAIEDAIYAGTNAQSDVTPAPVEIDESSQKDQTNELL